MYNIGKMLKSTESERVDKISMIVSEAEFQKNSFDRMTYNLSEIIKTNYYNARHMFTLKKKKSKMLS